MFVWGKVKNLLFKNYCLMVGTDCQEKEFASSLKHIT